MRYCLVDFKQRPSVFATYSNCRVITSRNACGNCQRMPYRGLTCRPKGTCCRYPCLLHIALGHARQGLKFLASALFYLGSCLAERFFPEHFEDEFVDILVSVVKPEFAFFQMKVKSVFCQPSKAHNARLGVGPEAFNAINM